MLVLSTLIFPQIILLCSILLAIVLGLLYLRRRGHLQSLQLIWFPLLGFAIFGICDALVTLEGTWQSPWREANPSMRAFLLWGGWWGQCLGSVLWILAWAVIFDAIETLSERMPKHRAVCMNWLRLWIAYDLAIGHLNGLMSWTDTKGWLSLVFLAFHHWWSSAAGWLNTLSPFGYPLYSGICFGGICTLIHVALVQWMVGKPNIYLPLANSSRD